MGSQKERRRAHCCHVLPNASEQPSPDESFPENVKDTDGTNSLCRDQPPRRPCAGDKWGIY